MTHTEFEAKRYRVFNEKINHFKDHREYGWLRKYADDAIKRSCDNVDFYGIKANDFIDTIIQLPIENIKNWLDGNNTDDWYYFVGANFVKTGGE